MRKTVKGFMQPKTFGTVVMLIGAYVLAVILLPKLWVAEIVNGVLITTGIAILWAYGPIALEGVRHPSRSTRQQYLAIGLCAVALCVEAFRIWSTIYLNIGQPSWMRQHWFPYASLYMLAMAFIFILRAPATLPGNRTRRSWRYIALSLIGGAIIAAVLLTVGRY